MTLDDMNRTLREAGLRPTLGRATVLKLIEEAGGAPRCCEDLYRSAILAGRSLNVSSIAHALADLERAGCIERSASGEARRLYYRLPERDKAGPGLPVVLELHGRRAPLDDPLIALRLARWLADQGAALHEGDALVVRIEHSAQPVPPPAGPVLKP